MTLKKYPPLREMFAALPEGTLTDGDNAILKSLSASLAVLREPPAATNVFTVEMRGLLLTRLKHSVAEVLDPHVPKRAPGRPRAPLKLAMDLFEDKLALLSLAIDDAWPQTVSQRPLAAPRAALDNAFTALLKETQALKLDTTELTDTWTRMHEGIDAYATRVFSEAPTPLAKSTAAAQMRLVFKVLARDAAGEAGMNSELNQVIGFWHTIGYGLAQYEPGRGAKLTLWRVRGMRLAFFPSAEAAQQVCAANFLDENVEQQAKRISSIDVWLDEDVVAPRTPV